MNGECRLCGAADSEAVMGPAGYRFFRCGACGLLSRPEHRPTGKGAIISEVVSGRLDLHRRLLDEIEAVVPGGRLLDVGCGSGEFLEMAASRGWDASGVECYAPAARLAEAKGLRIVTADLAAAALPGDSFDVVTLWDVADYLDAPRETLAEVHRVLRPGGMAWLRVRNAPFHMACAAWGRRLRLDALSRLAILHRHGFGTAQLRRLLSSTGFEGVRITHSPLARPDPYAAGLGWASSLLVRLASGWRGLPASLLAVARKAQGYPRVLHLVTRLDPGGSAENVILSAEGLRDRGSILVASGPGDSGPRRGVRVVRDLVREVSLWRDLLAFIELYALMVAWSPDILHTHTSKAGILGRWAARLANLGALRRSPVRVVHTPHGHVFYGYFGPVKAALFLWLERLSAPAADRLVAISEGERRESLERGVGRAEQWTVIPSGLRLERRSAAHERSRRRLRAGWGAGEQTLVVGTVARLEPVKGVSVLVEAASEIARGKPSSPVSFVVAGDGGLRSQLEARALKLGLGETLRFLGHQDDVAGCLAAMDIYVQPSLNEGMCKTLLQAQALGLPVVAARVCGIPDVVREGVSGLLVPPGDPRALAEALARLIEDAALRARLAAQAPECAFRPGEEGLPHFGVEAMLARLEALYEGLARPSGYAS